MVHFTTGGGVDVNQGYDTSVSLLNSGIYACQLGTMLFTTRKKHNQETSHLMLLFVLLRT